MPQIHVDVLELVGEPALFSATPAIVAAVRDAAGATLTRVPMRPEDIVDARAGGAGYVHRG